MPIIGYELREPTRPFCQLPSVKKPSSARRKQKGRPESRPKIAPAWLRRRTAASAGWRANTHRCPGAGIRPPTCRSVRERLAARPWSSAGSRSSSPSRRARHKTNESDKCSDTLRFVPPNPTSPEIPTYIAPDRVSGRTRCSNQLSGTRSAPPQPSIDRRAIYAGLSACCPASSGVPGSLWSWLRS